MGEEPDPSAFLGGLFVQKPLDVCGLCLLACSTRSSCIVKFAHFEVALFVWLNYAWWVFSRLISSPVPFALCGRGALRSRLRVAWSLRASRSKVMWGMPICVSR